MFTPQAAAAIGAMTAPEHRGGAITFIFIGWSLASVIGIPASAWLGDTFGWRTAFVAVAALAAFGSAWVYAVVPARVRPALPTMSAWRGALLNPVLMAMVLVTALACAGQFALFSYLAPYFKNVIGTSTGEATMLFVCFGVFGVIGNMIASRYVDRIGAERAILFALFVVAVAMLAWSWATSVGGLVVVIVPWALGVFAIVSLQQARLGAAAPSLASALLALNTSAVYLGQAAGASSGGWLIANRGYGSLSWVGLGWIVAAIALSLWASAAHRRMRR